jgi:hypothetical protein
MVYDVARGEAMKALVFSVAVAVCLARPLVARADTFVEPSSGVSFEKHPASGANTFLCLGAGVRKYLLWRLYAMDFCVEDGKARAEIDRYFSGPGRRYAGMTGRDLAKALADDQGFFDFLVAMPIEKRAEMVFLRGGDAEKAREGFSKNLEKFLGSGDREKAAIRDFVSAIDRPVSSGDRAVFVSHPGAQLDFTFGANTRSLRHEKAERAFWGAYLGADSPLGSMKEAVAQAVADLRSR